MSVIVTGASRGIGAAVAGAAAAAGARVGLIARDADGLASVAAACPGSAVAQADLTDRDQAIAAIERLGSALGPPDVLVNNAGVGAHGLVADTDIATFERLIALNYLGAVYATKAVLPGMLSRGRGHIVNIASINARVGAPFEAAYSASKFALAGFSDALTLELAGRGIGVTLINPGPVDTAFFEARGVPYSLRFPKPIPADQVARVVIRAVERGRAERFIPAWLGMPAAFKVLAPPLFRAGTRWNFRKQLSRSAR